MPDGFHMSDCKHKILTDFQKGCMKCAEETENGLHKNQIIICENCKKLEQERDEAKADLKATSEEYVAAKEEAAKLEKERDEARARFPDAEKTGFENHKLAVVTFFRLKSVGQEPEIAKVYHQWADAIASISWPNDEQERKP